MTSDVGCDGELLTLDCERIAAGGTVVARHQGQVVFVRHALPGERVHALVTGTGAGNRFLRADAVEILQASPARVEPPCRFAGPGACGGCDLQHVDLASQRELKAEVIREHFARIARLDVELTVEAMPFGDQAGLGWRSRIDFAVGQDGIAGLHRARSRDVVPVTSCLLARDPEAVDQALGRRWPAGSSVRVVAPAAGESRVLGPGEEATVVEPVHARYLNRSFAVAGGGFWQVHPAAAATLVDAVIEAVTPLAGERCLDLYAGAGLFAAALAEAVGPQGQVVAVEASPDGAAYARDNLHDLGTVVVVEQRVDRAFGVTPARSRRGRRGAARSPLLPPRADVVIADPPRSGLDKGVVEAVAGLDPRAIGYVSCDPATLARDVGYFAQRGYQLVSLRAFDAFPMTSHVECLALLHRL